MTYWSRLIDARPLPVKAIGPERLLWRIVPILHAEIEVWGNELQPLELDVELYLAPPELHDRVLLLAGPLEGDVPGRSIVATACSRSADSAAGACIGEIVERLSLRTPHLAHLGRWVGSSRELEAAGETIFPVADVVGRPRYPETWPFRPFDASLKMEWVEGEDLLNGGSSWVPASLLGYWDEPAERLTEVTSIGLAAGKDVPSATDHALHELLERDAMMRHWLSGRRFSSVLPLPDELNVIATADRDLGWETFFLTCRSRIGTEAQIVLSVNEESSMLATGSAAGPAHEARLHALDEMLMGRFVSMRNNDPPSPIIADFADHSTYYSTREGLETVTHRMLASEASEDATTPEPMTSLEAITRAGLMATRVQLTERDGPTVVRVLVTGLQPMESAERLSMIVAEPQGHYLPHPFV